MFMTNQGSRANSSFLVRVETSSLECPIALTLGEEERRHTSLGVPWAHRAHGYVSDDSHPLQCLGRLCNCDLKNQLCLPFYMSSFCFLLSLLSYHLNHLCIFKLLSFESFMYFSTIALIAQIGTSQASWTPQTSARSCHGNSAQMIALLKTTFVSNARRTTWPQHKRHLWRLLYLGESLCSLAKNWIPWPPWIPEP